MRTIKIFLLVFILSTTVSGQWEWKNPKPQANDLNDSYFIDEMNGWAVGDYGACIKTTDGGETWEHLQMLINTWYESIQFVNEDKGFIADWSGNLLTTTDAGYNWSVQHFDNYSRLKVFFINPNYGWLLSTNGAEKIYRTTDGGETWTFHPLITSRWMLDLYFIDTLKGFVTGVYGEILKTTNGGVNWNFVNSPVQEKLNKITFKDSLNGFIIGENGTILSTTDGGIIWDYHTIGQHSFQDITFIDDMNGILVGGSPKVFLTSDGGTTWVDRTSSTISTWALNSCNFLSETDCIIFGTLGDIYQSTDNGNNWISKVLGDRHTINDMTFIDYQTGYTVGSEGTVLRTTDRGNNWDKLNPLTNEELKSISFPDNLYGWIVGTHSVFLKSTSGGIGWTIDTIPDCNDLFSVDFIDNNIGWVAGNYNKVLKTTDGGLNWILQSLNFSHTIIINSISMVDETVGYLCGIYQYYYPYIGIILKTTNGGANWDSLFAINGEFKSIFFKDSLDGWVVGGGTTIHTSDGGISWLNVPIGGGDDIFFDENLNGIKISNADILGSNIAITTDGGESWSNQPRFADRTLYAAYIVENNFWVTGSYGTIIFSDNPIITGINKPDNNYRMLDDYILFHNYPNPFNPVTKIKYSITSVGIRWTVPVQLKVYDILGREIRTLVSEEKQVGKYEVEFDGSGLSSGVYLYRLTIGNFSVTKKMVLIK
jgi:photosystem II stability/assembly factor-like uncharacterized protein